MKSICFTFFSVLNVGGILITKNVIPCGNRDWNAPRTALERVITMELFYFCRKYSFPSKSVSPRFTDKRILGNVLKLTKLNRTLAKILFQITALHKNCVFSRKVFPCDVFSIKPKTTLNGKTIIKNMFRVTYTRFINLKNCIFSLSHNFYRFHRHNCRIDT